MTDIKMPPLPKWLLEGFTDPTIERLCDYIHAIVAHATASRDAEIRRLQTELEIRKDQAEFYRITRNWNQQKARRLEEAEAEVSLLRAEREVIGAEAVKYADKSGRLNAKVERLTEALRFARTRFAPYMDDTDRAAFDAALRDHDQEEYSDDR